MNWTGGRLSRHSLHAKGSLTQRQKQYFAKIRKNSLSGAQKGSPIKWLLFEQDQTAPQYNIPDPSTAASILSDQTNSQPYRRLCEDVKKRVRHSDETCLISSASAVTQQKPPSSRRVRSFYNEHHLNHYPFDSPHESLSAQDSKRGQHKNSIIFENDVLTGGPDKEESLEDRRRKLLNRSDWIGADIQRPLKLKYTSLTTDGKIGKRRRIDPDENTFGAILQPVISPFEEPRQKSVTRETALTYPYRNETQSGNITKSRNHARISIGGKNKFVGVTSSTSYRTMQIDRSMSSQASIPDIMLLDGEDANKYNTSSRDRERQCSDPPLPLLPDSKAVRVHSRQTNVPQKRSGPYYGEWTSGRQKVFSSNIHSEVKAGILTTTVSARKKLRIGEPQATGKDVCFRSFSNGTPLGKLHDEKSLRSEASIMPCLGSSKLQSLGAEGFDDITNLQHRTGGDIGHQRTQGRSPSPQEYCLTSMSKQPSNSARKLHPISWNRAQNLSHFSPRPQLLHPIPRSSKKPPVLLISSPDDDGSVIAQPDALKPIIPQCQLLDEKVWKTWILSLDTKDNADDFEQHDIDEVSFSPGTSTATHLLDQDSSSRRKIAKENILLAGHKEDPETRFSYGRELEHGNIDREKTSSVDLLQDKRKICFTEEALPTLPVTAYKKHFLLRSKPARSPPKAVLQPSPEEAWMKFILTDSTDYGEDRSIITSPRPQKKLFNLPRLSPPKSSSLAHLSAKATLCTHPSSLDSKIRSSSFATEATIGDTATIVPSSLVSNHSTRDAGISLSPDPISRSPSHLLKSGFLFSSKGTPTSDLPTAQNVLFRKPPSHTLHSRSGKWSPDELAGGKYNVSYIRTKRKVLGKGVEKYSGRRSKGHRLKDVYSLSSSDDDA